MHTLVTHLPLAPSAARPVVRSAGLTAPFPIGIFGIALARLDSERVDRRPR